MVERRTGLDAQETLEKVKSFANQLADWDIRIVEISAIGSLSPEEMEEDSTIDLVCTFDPEPPGDSSGYFSVINLALRDDHEGVSEKMGIQQQIDLGFHLDGKVYLASGEILADLGEHIVLWTQNDR